MLAGVIFSFSGILVFLCTLLLIENIIHAKRVDRLHRFYAKELRDLARHAFVSQRAADASDAANASIVLQEGEQLTKQTLDVAGDFPIFETNDAIGFKAIDNGKAVEIDFLTQPGDTMLAQADRDALLFTELDARAKKLDASVKKED